nr:uncharacterized protein LOC116434968 [Nomia melanderi]
MEDKLVCDDPQFITMLDTLLQVEVEAAKKTLHSLDTEVKEIKKKTKQQWRMRKELNEGIKNTNENIIVLTVSLNKQRKYNDELLNKIELTKLNLNDEYKVRKSEFEEQETILKEYENAWKDYHAQYEEYPLAKVRKTARMELRKLEVERAVIDQKIIELRKMSRQKQQIGWMRLRGKLVELARTVLENMALDRRLEELLENIKCRTQELNAIEEEVSEIFSFFFY